VRIQLWSYNYAPEPTGIAPLSTQWADAMAARGHEVTVVAAHPHYPEPAWGRARRPYRERVDGIAVLRLPLKIGRSTSAERLVQELSYVSGLAAVTPVLPRADVIVAVSPSFPALAPAMAAARVRRVPWVMWLQDILPDGAVATAILPGDGHIVRAARRFERAAYRSASRIVVISGSFEQNLRAKGVPAGKIERIYNLASLPVRGGPRPHDGVDPRRLMTMGNIGHSQGLAGVVKAFEASDELAQLGATFTLVGDGVAGDEVRAAIRTDRVRVTGVLHDTAELRDHLLTAGAATVTQRYEGQDFNVPSKLMNFMGQSLPVVACVRPDSEVARILEDSGGGWVASNADPARWATLVARVMRDRGECERRAEAGLAFARRHFTPAVGIERFETVLRQVIAGRQ
jgi:colanic acid biosynthesis glycosyl transferase WcaI